MAATGTASAHVWLVNNQLGIELFFCGWFSAKSSLNQIYILAMLSLKGGVLCSYFQI